MPLDFLQSTLIDIILQQNLFLKTKIYTITTWTSSIGSIIRSVFHTLYSINLLEPKFYI